MKQRAADSLPWQPSAALSQLKLRAHFLQTIRHFFAERGVLEVDTPLICHTSVTDPFIESIPVICKTSSDSQESRYYLQTSPEYAMKRLLAAGCGAIYQISKAFRQGEVGRLHNPEFTMLEWYRPGFNHHQLMDEMDDFLQLLLAKPRAARYTYAEVFQTFLEIDAHSASAHQLRQCAENNHIHAMLDTDDRDIWLDLLMTHCIEPQLGKQAPCFIYDFPASQAALARVVDGVAARFEVYYQGMELANGFDELQNADEQRARFLQNIKKRAALNLPYVAIDELFLAALEHGLPDCAGVALGFDRLMMLATHATHIKEVLSFDFPRV